MFFSFFLSLYPPRIQQNPPCDVPPMFLPIGFFLYGSTEELSAINEVLDPSVQIQGTLKARYEDPVDVFFLGLAIGIGRLGYGRFLRRLIFDDFCQGTGRYVYHLYD